MSALIRAVCHRPFLNMNRLDSRLWMAAAPTIRTARHGHGHLGRPRKTAKGSWWLGQWMTTWWSSAVAHPARRRPAPARGRAAHAADRQEAGTRLAGPALGGGQRHRAARYVVDRRRFDRALTSAAEAAGATWRVLPGLKSFLVAVLWAPVTVLVPVSARHAGAGRGWLLPRSSRCWWPGRSPSTTCGTWPGTGSPGWGRGRCSAGSRRPGRPVAAVGGGAGGRCRRAGAVAGLSSGQAVW